MQINNVRYEEVISLFESLKQKYAIVLVSTNKSDAIQRVLSIVDLNSFVDEVYCSLPKEKDDKIVVFKRFIEKKGKPICYIGHDKKETYTFCKEKQIPALYVDFDKSCEGIEGVPHASSVNEIKQFLDKLTN